MKTLLNLIPFNGHKTYIVGVIAVGLGIWIGNNELIFLGLGLLGIRHALDK